MKKTKKRASGSSKAEAGNVTIDLGEALERKLASSGMGAGRKSGPKSGKSGYAPGQYRPGMFGGYRPWYASRYSSTMGKGLVSSLGIPKESKTSELLTGLAIGVALNRGLLRLSEYAITSTKSPVLHNLVAFTGGLVPLAVKQNSMNLGISLPGAAFLAGSLVDAGLGWLEGPKASPAASGSRPNVGSRERLANMAQRLQRPQVAGARPQTPRVLARPA